MLLEARLQLRLTNLEGVGGYLIGFSYGIGCPDREMYATFLLPQSRATTEIVRAAITFSLLKYFFTYSAIIATKIWSLYS